LVRKRFVCQFLLTGTFGLFAALGCGSSGGSFLDVGEDEAGGTFVFGDGAATGTTGSLDAHLEDDHVTVNFVTLTCADRCATLQAVATGGQPPYSFAWDDGSTSATRTFCPATDTTYRVTVHDTGKAGELGHAQQTAVATLAADVVACPDAGALADAGEAGDPGACNPDATAGITITPDILANVPSWFEGGASLPAGRYRIAWVDGCIRYDPTIYFWTVNGAFNFEYWIIGATTSDLIQVAPGLSSIAGDANYSDCVTASRGQYVDVDFAGGKLGIYNNDFKPADNTASPTGVNPTWTLQRICP
jgi:hypothetical protein